MIKGCLRDRNLRFARLDQWITKLIEILEVDTEILMEKLIAKNEELMEMINM